jgi:HAD superfamily hydrolase (TIGR01450 family)
VLTEAADNAEPRPFDRSLGTKRVAFLDLDGTLYRGDSVIPGAPEFVAELGARGVAAYFLTNNSSRSRRGCLTKLSSMGIAAEENRIVLSTDGCAEHLSKEGLTRVFAVGTRSFCEELAAHGIEADLPAPQAVVLGYDTETTYERLARASLLIRRGLPYFATHPDMTCPSPEGPLPDAGSFAALIEAATGRRPDRVFGKPDASMVEHVLSYEGARFFFNDTATTEIYTDFALARNVGCEFVCVLTGEATREDVERCDHAPSLVAESVAHIIG